MSLGCSLLAVLPHLHTVGLPQVPPRFQVKVEAVLVDAYVGRGGEAVKGLTASDFIVLDNGIPQSADLVASELLSLNATLVLDTSSSVSGQELEHLREAGHAFLAGLTERDQAGLVTFSHHLKLRTLSPGDRTPLSQALAMAKAEGGTSLHDAIFAGLLLAEQPGRRPMLLVFTDGEDQHSRLTEQEVVEHVRRFSSIIYTVETASPILAGRIDREVSRAWRERSSRTGLLRQIAALSGGRSLTAGFNAGLKQAFLKILEELNDRYLLTFAPSGVPREGWHALEVRLTRHKGEVRARRGYFVPSPPR